MTGRSSQQSYIPSAAGNNWGTLLEPVPEPDKRKQTQVAVALVVFLALAIVCVVAFLMARMLGSGSPLLGLLPASTRTAALTPDETVQLPVVQPSASVPPGQLELDLSPDRGYVGTLVSVTGRGWWPGEPVFVLLISPGEAGSPAYSYAAAVANDQGEFRTAFTFPSEARWIGQAWAEVSARGSRSGWEARARFDLEAPASTPTAALPTARPTVPPTETPVPTVTPVPSPTAAPTALITEWRGEYYANTSFSGEPALVRNDSSIDFDWGQGSPATGLPVDSFGVRWRRQLFFSQGLYRFLPAADDGVRLWIDGQLLVDQWHDGSFTLYPVEVMLAEGSHALLLEYYENLGHAQVQLAWTQILDTPTPSPSPTPTWTPVPPTPTQTPPSTPPTNPFPLGPWQAEYYDNPNLAGAPRYTRWDAKIDFDWGTLAAGDVGPVDQFSVRWTQSVQVASGTYRFFADVDDGIRIWVDGVAVIDEWHAVSGQLYSADVYLTAGDRAIEVDYLELVDTARVRVWVELVSSP